MGQKDKVNLAVRVLLVFVALVVLLGWQPGGVAQAEVLAAPALIGDTLTNQYVSAGTAHTCGWKDDGSIVCWGGGTTNTGTSSEHGQSIVPLPISGFNQVSVGYSHSCGLTSDGSIVCWGWNPYGQSDIPTSNSGFIQVSAGGNHTCGLKSGGGIVCWGWNSYGQTDIPLPNSGFTQVSGGGNHTCGLKSDSSIVCWGWNLSGQSDVPLPNSGFTQVSAGGYHTCGLKSDDSIVCWGRNIFGQSTVPAPNSGFTQISAGNEHTCGLKSTGSIACWGAGTTNTGAFPEFGQSIITAPNSGFTQVSAGGIHTCGLKSDGSIVCWGDNSDGQRTVPAPNINFGLAPPTVVSINSLPDTGDGVLSDGESTALGITQLLITFIEDVVGRLGPGAANDPDNYLLFSDGGDGFQTVDCAGGVAAGDVNITISAASYDDQDGVGPFVATITLNSGAPLPAGEYRFLVCGSTSVEDYSGLAINGGVDEVLNFTISGGGGGGGGTETLPETGFAPGVISTLPIQPAEKTYADLGDLWLEVPKLDVAVPIVGVPKVDGDWDVDWLGAQAGWLEGSAYPTLAGNTVLTAHVWDAYDNPGPFINLKKLVHGDQVHIHSSGMVYTYEVRYNYLVRPDNPYVMRHEEYDWVTLLTCENYNPDLEIYSFRRVVRAVLVGVNPE